LIGIAWILSLAVVTLTGLETRYGLGRHHKDIPVRYQNVAIKLSYANIIIYQLALIVTKLSILMFYLRILKFPLQRVLIFCTIGFVCLYGSILVPFSAVICDPLTGQRALTIGTCYTYYPIMTASAIIHTATDVWLIILVLPHVVKMQIPKKQKAGLAFVLTLGLFDACASLTRISIAHRFLNPRLAQWDSFSFAIWTTLETSLGVICASIPMLRPMARQIMGRKPSSAPEMVMGNVPRSNKGRPKRAVEDSLWSNNGEVVELTDSHSLNATPEHLKVQVVTDFGSARSASVSTGTTAVANSDANV
jgi:hypothetical protein